MTTALTDVDAFTSPVLTVVDSVDAASASTVTALLQPLANRTYNLKLRLDALPAAAKWTVTAIKTASYTAAFGEVVRVDTSGGAVTIGLPTAVGNGGKTIIIKKVDAGTTNDVTIDGNASETLDGSTTITIAAASEAKGVRRLVSDGSNWMVC